MNRTNLLPSELNEGKKLFQIQLLEFQVEIFIQNIISGPLSLNNLFVFKHLVKILRRNFLFV